VKPVPYLAQATAGGCGACSFIMVARYFDPSLTLTEDEALQMFGVDGFGPRCFALAPSFNRAGSAFGLGVQIKSTTREEFRVLLAAGPVITYHKASEAADAVPHFSVAIGTTVDEIIRHDPGLGPAIVDSWARFERLWADARVSWWPQDGFYTAVLRPKL
jgi:ABC-type bacteriocin/lantibiotic exporter with double-glycine peptidase domain